MAESLDPRLDKIRKLIALATNNPNEEEARSAALKAIQLMVEHDVDITLPAVAAPSPSPPPFAYGAPSRDDLMREVLRHMGEQQQWAANQQYDAMRNSFNYTPPSAPQPTPEPPSFWGKIFR